jgi:hypothetical protein
MLPTSVKWHTFCPATRQRHNNDIDWCGECNANRTEIIDLSDSPLAERPSILIPNTNQVVPRNTQFVRPAKINRVGETERESVNQRIRHKTVSDSKTHAGAQIFNTQSQIMPCTTPPGPWDFQIVMITRRYTYKSVQDREDGILTETSKRQWPGTVYTSYDIYIIY